MSLSDSPFVQAQVYPGGPVGILLIHGFTGTPAHFYPLAQLLREEGYTVRVPLLPGHGTYPADLQRCTRQDWLYAVRKELSALRESCTRIVVCGLSMGALLALILAAESPVDGCICLSTPLITANRFRHLALPASWFFSEMPKKPSPLRKELLAEYDLDYQVFPVRGTHELNCLIRQAKKALPLVRCPVLGVQSRADTTVSPESLNRLLHGLSCEQKQSLWLDHAHHVCTLSPERNKVESAILQFLQSCK